MSRRTRNIPCLLLGSQAHIEGFHGSLMHQAKGKANRESAPGISPWRISMLGRLAAFRSDMTEAQVARSTAACQRPCGASSFARIIFMRTRYTGLICAAFSVLLCAAAAFASPNKSIPISSGWLLQDAARVPQSGEAIASAPFQPAGWHPATVPGPVLTSLVNDGTYPEPLYGENNRPDRIPDTLCHTTWWYRTVFAPPAAGTDGRIWLNFDGINYLAEVWLNGHELGTIKGAFTRGIFDVTPKYAKTR